MSLAAALAGLQVEYVDGITDVDKKILPPGGAEAGLNRGNLGSWRAHVTTLRTYVKCEIVPSHRWRMSGERERERDTF